MADLLQDMSDDNNVDDGNVDEKALKDPDMQNYSRQLLIVTTKMTFCLGA
jgi:hypothetical protein